MFASVLFNARRTVRVTRTINPNIFTLMRQMDAVLISCTLIGYCLDGSMMTTVIIKLLIS